MTDALNLRALAELASLAIFIGGILLVFA